MRGRKRGLMNAVGGGAAAAAAAAADERKRAEQSADEARGEEGEVKQRKRRAERRKRSRPAADQWQRGECVSPMWPDLTTFSRATPAPSDRQSTYFSSIYQRNGSFNLKNIEISSN